MAANRHLSDVQTREISAIFRFLDVDGDGHITSEAALKLCSRLGYDVDRTDARQQNLSPLLSLQEVLGWCEAYSAACHRSEDLHLAQLFALLQKNRRLPTTGLPSYRLTNGLTAADLHEYLEGEQHAVDDGVLSAFVEEVIRCSYPRFDVRAPQHGLSPFVAGW